MVKSFALLVYALRGPFHGLRFSYRVPVFLFPSVLSLLARSIELKLAGKCRLRASLVPPFLEKVRKHHPKREGPG